MYNTHKQQKTRFYKGYKRNMFIDEIPEIQDYKNFVKLARKTAKKRLGGQMLATKNPQGESKEEYDLTLKDETRLEVAFLLRELAERIEQNTLRKTSEKRAGKIEKGEI